MDKYAEFIIGLIAAVCLYGIGLTVTKTDDCYIDCDPAIVTKTTDHIRIKPRDVQSRARGMSRWLHVEGRGRGMSRYF